jgi:DNA-binding Lrp family transcriptional regulator
MVTGIVLINVERHLLQEVIKDVLALDGVTEVYSVAGEYDLVAMVRVKDNAKLSEIVADKMPHHVKGIVHTKTLITLTAHSDIDLEAAFNLK